MRRSCADSFSCLNHWVWLLRLNSVINRGNDVDCCRSNTCCKLVGSDRTLAGCVIDKLAVSPDSGYVRWPLNKGSRETHRVAVRSCSLTWPALSALRSGLLRFLDSARPYN